MGSQVSEFPSIPAGTTLLTVNRRLARGLRAASDAQQLAAGRAVWEPADILPHTAWLERTWRSHVLRAERPPPVWLSAWQERALWEDVLRRSEVSGRGAPLLQVEGAARRAQEARALLKAHRCERDFASEPLAEDALVFRGWLDAVLERCADAHWTDGASVPEHLAQGLHAMPDELPARLWLAGFDELTPQLEALLQALRAEGVAVARWAPPARAGRAVRVAFETGEEELVTAARWARRFLEDGHEGPVGVVIPDLAARRARVERVFDEVLGTGAPRDHGAPPWSMSLGPALDHRGVIADALRLLRLARGPLAFAAVGQLMLSPYFRGGDSELGVRARCEAALRERAPPELSLHALRAYMGRLAQAHPAPLLAGMLDDLAAAVARTPRIQSAAGWARTFWQWLVLAGWPARERSLTSTEYQAVQAFAEVVDALASLSPVLEEHTLEAALSRLRRMAAERAFQPHTEPAPVQVLGMLEATGLRFPHLWVVGLHDGAWPSPARPNPFLPVTLQRRYGMPHASAEREFEFARRVTARLLESADDVVLSHAVREEEAPLGPSPLISALPALEAPGVPVSAWRSPAWHVHAARPALEEWTDERAPALAPGERVRGGAGILRDQAACPFRAFAAHRLGARALPYPAPGPDAPLRGRLVHRLLAAIWAELGSQARLALLDDGALEALVARATETALAHEAVRHEPLRRRRFRELEHRRLQCLARSWLEVERRRAPFEVLALEQEVDARIGDLGVTLRIDRIDRIPGRGALLIDYKTGRTDVNGWFGARPDEPQLPLYCTAVPEAAAGAAYGSLRPGDVGFKGLASAGDIAPGVRHEVNWGRLKAQWRETLSDLAAAFTAGDARVDPKRAPETCRGCDLHALCRIHDEGTAATGGRRS